MTTIDTAIQTCPLVGILRGLTPDRAKPVGETLYQAGLRVIEVPINSPSPYESIAILRQSLPEDCAVGAGTLRTVDNLRALKDAGGTIAVMPHTNSLLITTAIELGLLPMPGVFTPSEMFAALDAGAAHLKIFPANVAGQPLVKAVRSVLPPHTKLFAVGGISASTIPNWTTVDGFGVGSSIFKPTDSIDIIRQKATLLVEASRQWQHTQENV